MKIKKGALIYICINTAFLLITLVFSLVSASSFGSTDNAVIEAIATVAFVIYLLIYIPMLFYFGIFLWIPHIVLFWVLLILEIKSKEKSKRYITTYSALFAVNTCLNVLAFWSIYLLKNYHTFTV
jgi:hypothetical protein